jgi:hypothetical protein
MKAQKLKVLCPICTKTVEYTITPPDLNPPATMVSICGECRPKNRIAGEEVK